MNSVPLCFVNSVLLFFVNSTPFCEQCSALFCEQCSALFLSTVLCFVNSVPLCFVNSILWKVCRFRGSNREKGELNAAAWFTQPGQLVRLHHQHFSVVFAL